jgi:hypothetical protein
VSKKQRKSRLKRLWDICSLHIPLVFELFLLYYTVTYYVCSVYIL